ncbi:MAG: GAF domain-containing protein, partial [Aggregatilineales bacterium]
MPENNQAPSLLRQLQEAKTLLTGVMTSLENQKLILKQRGMTLPPMVNNTLKGVERTLKKTENGLIEDETELGQLRALAEMSASITTSLDVDTVLEEAMDIVIALTRAERGYIILVDTDTGELEFRVSREDALNPTRSGGIPQVSRSVLKHVLQNREALLADNAFEDKRFEGNASIANFSLRSVLCVPLLYKGDIIGVVYVDNRLQAGIFTEREKSTLVAFANTAAVAIANAFLYSDIQRVLSEITGMKDLMDNIFASIGSGVIATDAGDLVQTFNRAAASILTRQNDETIGQPLATVLPKISADFPTYLADTRETGASHTLEGEFVNNDNKRIAVNVKLSPLKDAHDETQGVAVVLDDITRQFEQNQPLRLRIRRSRRLAVADGPVFSLHLDEVHGKG